MKSQLIRKACILFLVALAITSLSCQAAISLFHTPTPTLTSTLVQTLTPTVTPLANTAGVQKCYYVPGVSVPAQMPPDVVASPTPYLYPTLTPPPVTKVDASTTANQLKVFTELWQDVNDNYVYTDFNSHDWKAIGNRYQLMIERGLSDQDFYIAMREMVFELGDDHSTFMSPEEVKAEEEALAGKHDFVGIGAMVSSIGDLHTGVILSVFPGSLADQAGLRLHDKITAVDGGPIWDETGTSHTLGPADTPVTITVQRPGENPKDIKLIRKPISSSLPIDYCVVPTTRIGYIFLPSFDDDTIPDQVRTALTKMAADGPLDGLVIDNRMNRGGVSTVVLPILGFFTSGVQGRYVSRTESEAFTIDGEDINGLQTVPLAILVDEDTVSFGEIFSGILRVSDRAVIIERNTFGNVEILGGFNFSDGSRAWIASYTIEPIGEANGVWEQTGIIPDYMVPTRWDLFTEATDPALAKAVEVLQEQK